MSEETNQSICVVCTAISLNVRGQPSVYMPTPVSVWRLDKPGKLWSYYK